MGEITHHSDYRRALVAMKQRIQISQIRAEIVVNTELLIQPTVEKIQSELAHGNGSIPSND